MGLSVGSASQLAPIPPLPHSRLGASLLPAHLLPSLSRALFPSSLCFLFAIHTIPASPASPSPRPRTAA